MVTDYGYTWPEGEDAAAVFFEELSSAGADYVHTTERNATEPTFGTDGPSLAEAAVEHVVDGTLVIANGGLEAPATARDAVESGADLVTLGTGALANPDWPKRVTAGGQLREFDRAALLQPEASISAQELSIDSPYTDESA